MIKNTPQQSLVEKVAIYVQKRFENDKTGHDWFHIYRVWQLAKIIQKEEGGDLELIELSALLHGATEENNKKTENKRFRSLAMEGLLDVLGISGKQKDEIIRISNEKRFAGIETVRPKDIECQIVQDANWLDGLGAIGIARVFTAGGHFGRLIHDPTQEPMRNLDRVMFESRKRSGTSLNYFIEKSLLIADLLNTKTAKKIAKNRIEYLKKYLEQFDKEWELKDYNP